MRLLLSLFILLVRFCLFFLRLTCWETRTRLAGTPSVPFKRRERDFFVFEAVQPPKISKSSPLNVRFVAVRFMSKIYVFTYNNTVC